MAMPVYVFWKEFLEVFPEAKVVHYPREVEAWQRSSQVQLKELIKVKRFPDEISYFFMRFFAPETYRCHLWQDRCNKLIIGQEVDGFYTLKNGRMQADQLLNGVRYRTHNADVELNCPKEKILVLSKTTFNWETICAFVGKPIPTDDQGQPIDFPHVNKAGAFAKDAFKKADAPLVKLYKKEVIENTIKYLTGALLGYGLYRYRDHVIEGLKSYKLALNWK